MDQLSKDLLHFEEQLLDPVLRKDREYISGLLADEFREFGSSGRTFLKEDILLCLANESDGTVALENFRADEVSSDVFLVSYCAVRRSTDETVARSLRSSLWILRDARWQMLFHQGTKVY